MEDRKRFLEAGKLCLFSLIEPRTATVSKQDDQSVAWSVESHTSFGMLLQNTTCVREVATQRFRQTRSCRRQSSSI